MELKNKVFAKDRKAWRSWLTKHGESETEVWLVYYKKTTGKDSVQYLESVEEAICFGWIDGIKRRIDDETYAHRFSPRRQRSKWSPLNIKVAQKMKKCGLMTETGLAAFNRREEYNTKVGKTRAANPFILTAEIEKTLRRNKKAWDNFNKLAPSYQKQFIGWLVTAKKPETRERRLKEALQLLERNEKLGMK